MDIDPNDLDPELRFARLYAIASTALGVIGLCLGVIPACSLMSGLVGIVLGVLSLRTENSKLANIGIGISSIGILASLIYVIGKLYFGN